MNFNLFSCNKCNSSVKSSFLASKDISSNEKENGNKQLLPPSDDNKSTSDYLEIIDYPYSLNNNDDKTIEMNSNQFDDKTKSKINSFFEEEQNENANFFKNKFYKNPSNSSSGIINNEDSIIQNKMLLTNYYNNLNENAKKENINQIKAPLTDVNLEKRKNYDNIGIKVEYPCCDEELVFSKTNEKLNHFKLNKTNITNTNLKKKLKVNLKNEIIIKKNKTNTFSLKHNQKTKRMKTLETNKSYISPGTNSKFCSLINNNLFNTHSSNNIKEYKLFRGKLKNILTRSKKGINGNKFCRKIKTKNKTANVKINNDFLIKKISISRTQTNLMSTSNVNFISSILKRINSSNSRGDTIKNTIPGSRTKITIKARNPDKHLINKKNNKNPFTVIEKTKLKTSKLKYYVLKNQ